MTQNKHIWDFKGQKAAIDIMTWIYKGSYTISDKIVKNETDFSYLSYPIKMIQLCVNNGVTPILVFDGWHLEAKAVTENSWIEEKLQMKKKGKELEEAGYDQDAKKCYNRSVQITAEMIDVLIDLLQMMHFEIIVAPYEADA